MLQLFAVVSQLRRQAYIFSRRLRYLPDKIGVNNPKNGSRSKKQVLASMGNRVWAEKEASTILICPNHNPYICDSRF